MRSPILLAILSAGVCTCALVAIPAIAATDAASSSSGVAPPGSGQANDGQSLTTADILVTGSRASSDAPMTASLATTQPQSIVSRDFIQNILPVSADFNAIALLAPGVSMSGAGNGPGLAESKIQIRGFQDGEYNVTYDSIPFSDTNNPTHHSTAFFPSNTIETLVVDRGPGNASQLGQATYGGNLNIYSRAATDQSGGRIDLTGGSFGTFIGRAEYQTGAIDRLNGAKFVVTGQILTTQGALTYEPEHSKNIFAKGVIPIGDHNVLTLLATYNSDTYYQSDTGTGTCGDIRGENCLPTSSIGLYGKDFGLDNDPSLTNRYAQAYWKYNQTRKKTDFEIARLQTDLGSGFSLDNRFYLYGYTNHTGSGQDATGGTPNTVVLTPGGAATPGVPGYDKLNKYRTWGYIGQVDYHFSHGRVRVGGWYENSDSNRYTIDYDLTTGEPNYRESPVKYVSQGGFVPDGTPQPAANISYLQDSGWSQFQFFAEFEYHPVQALSITPGIKYVDFTRSIDAAVNQKSRTPIDARKSFTKALPFLTANLSLTGRWSAYFQYAKGMYVPDLSSFYSPVPTLLSSLDDLKAETTTNYQLGSVYHGNRFTVDGDIYLIKVNNKIAANPVGDGTLVNLGRVTYKGIESEASYVLGHGLTVFANGSLAQARNETTGHQIAQAPYSTAAGGILFHHQRWFAAYTEKYTGAQYGAEDNPLVPYRLYRMSPYWIGNLAVSYDLGRFRLGLNVDNILNDRHVNTIKTSSKGAPTTLVNGTAVQSGYGPYDQLVFNSPRSIQGSVSLRF